MQTLPITVCAMATRTSDQALVRDLAAAYPDKVVPCFGYHPWFTHWISLSGEQPPSKEEHYRALFLSSGSDLGGNSNDCLEWLQKLLPSLPEPMPLGDLLSALRENLELFPNAMLGEVGLDRSCRVPFDYRTAQRKLSPFTIPFEHQLAVFEAQVDLAVELRRNISFHSVKAPKATLDVLARMKARHGCAWTRISVDMHSCGLSAEVWKDIQKSHSNVFLSLSTAINTRSAAHRSLISVVSPDRLLVESDIHEIEQCAERTWEMLCIISEVRGWNIEQSWEASVPESQWGTVRRLEENWKSFQKGEHMRKGIIKGNKESRKMKEQEDWTELESD